METLKGRIGMRLKYAAKTSSGCIVTQAPEDGSREDMVSFLMPKTVA